MGDNYNIEVTLGSNTVEATLGGNGITVNFGEVLPSTKDVWAEDKFTATAGQTIFPLTSIPKANSCSVFKNGILQEVLVDYTLSGSTLTFLSSCDVGDKINAKYVIA